MRSTFKLLFYVKRNVPKSDNSLPLMGRITINKGIVQFSLKMSVPPELWDSKAGKAMGKSEKAKDINRQLEQIRVTINNRYQEIIQAGGGVTAEQVKNAYLGIGIKQDMFLKLFAWHNELFARKVGNGRTQNTYKKYCNLYKLMQSYILKEYKREDISLKELNLSFINGFEHFLRTVRGCCTNTIWLYMIGVKHIISVARNEGLLVVNPFAGYMISLEQVDRGFLSEEELQLLMKAPMKNKSYELVRDLFVFAAFTGLAYSDIKNLTKNNLQTFLDGHLWIITRRQKTNVDSNIRLLDVPKRIIAKYEGQTGDDRLFAVPSNWSCNNILKNIGKQCGFKIKLTFHVGRHTFSTSLTLAKGMPIETVSRILGHTNIKTTQIYAKITNEKVSRDMELLSQKLAGLEKQLTATI